MRVSRHCRNVKSGSVIGTLSFGWSFNPETQVVTVLYTFCQEMKVTRAETPRIERLDTFHRHIAALHLEGTDIQLKEETVESETLPSSITVRSKEFVDFTPMKIELSLDYLQDIALSELDYSLRVNEDGALVFEPNPDPYLEAALRTLRDGKELEEEPISMSSFLEFLMLDFGIIGTRYHYITERERIAINFFYGGENCEILPERSFGRN